MRWGAVSLVALIAAGAFAADSAEARSRRHHRVSRVIHVHRGAPVERYVPPYASIVVDANSGAVLESDNADSPRHPASLTKIMTLYLLFERLEQGKIKLTTEMPVSEHASVQAPSKLGLKPGESIAVETAIRAIVTKSANDVAVVVAEALGGSEEEFGKLMTRKAHALGMKNTTYHNASGLPDDTQITTARDQTVLGRAIQERFPQYYKYFSTRNFVFRGKPMRNHNKLLGAVAGVDGIKTGYTNASGFNLVTSVRRGGRHIVAAVFGGRTASWRDARMHDLIEKYVMTAALKHTAPMIAENSAAVPQPQPQKVASTGAVMRIASAEPVKTGPAPGSTAPIAPNAVKTFKVKVSTVQMAAMAPLPTPHDHLTPAPASTASVTTIPTVKSDATKAPISKAELAKPEPKAEVAKIEPPKTEPLAPPPGAKPGVLGVLHTRVASAGDSVPVAAARPEPVAKPRGGWIIQVGAFDDESEAKQRLSAARNEAKDLLGQADPFTERVSKGDKTLYRARFAGLDKDQAENACRHLKRGEIPCMLIKN